MTYKLGTEIKCAGWVTIAFTGKAVVITRKVGGGKRIPIGAIASLERLPAIAAFLALSFVLLLLRHRSGARRVS